MSFALHRSGKQQCWKLEGRSGVAASSTDRMLAHSLWLQRRSAGRRACRVRWRSDWAPLGMLLVLIGILMLLSVFMPSNEAVEGAKEAAHNAVNQQQQAPMVGALVEPQPWRD